MASFSLDDIADAPTPQGRGTGRSFTLDDVMDQDPVSAPAAPPAQASAYVEDGMPAIMAPVPTGQQRQAAAIPEPAPFVPQDQSTTAGAMGRQFARGAIETAALAPKGAAALGARLDYNEQDIAGTTDRYAAANPQERAQIRREVMGQFRDSPGTRDSLMSRFSDIDEGVAVPRPQAVTPVEERATYKAGEAIDEFGRTRFPTTRAEDEAFWTGQIPRALGSTAAMAPVALAGAPLGAVGRLLAGAGIAMTGSGEATQTAVDRRRTLEDMVRSGDAPSPEAYPSDRQIATAAGQGLAPGALDAAAIDNLLRPVLRGPGWRGVVTAIAKKAIEQGIVEGTTEGVQQVLQNLITRFGYDPDQGVLEQVAENVLVGGVVGILTGGLAGGVAPRRAAPPAPQVQPVQQQGTAPVVSQETQAPGLAGTGAERVEVPQAAPTAAPAASPATVPVTPPLNPAEATGQTGTSPDIVPSVPPVPSGPVPGTPEDFADVMADPRPVAEIMAERQAKAEREATIAAVTAEDGPEAAAAVVKVLDGQGTRTAPVQVETVEDIEAAAALAAQPTPAQAEAGNYRHGHVRIAGLDISIETPRGGTRTGIDADGRPWSNADYPAHYGYFKRSSDTGDGKVDVFVGDEPAARLVYVIDQIDPKTGKFDEPKVMVGFEGEALAAEVYQASYSDGSGAARMGAITPMTLPELQVWLKSGDPTKALAYEAPPPVRTISIDEIAPVLPASPAPAADPPPGMQNAAPRPTPGPPVPVSAPVARNVDTPDQIANRVASSIGVTLTPAERMDVVDLMVDGMDPESALEVALTRSGVDVAMEVERAIEEAQKDGDAEQAQPDRAAEPRAVAPAEVEQAGRPERPAAPEGEARGTQPAGDRPAEGEEAGTAVEAPRTTFRTSKGSTYEAFADGTTKRNKSLHPEHGAADVGPKPRSQTTFYVTPEQADLLSLFQTRGAGKLAIQKTSDGRWAVRYLEGENAGKFERRTVVEPKTEPAVGLLPVEIWENGERVHFGNEIVSIDGAKVDAPRARAMSAKAKREEAERKKRDAAITRREAAKKAIETRKKNAGPLNIVQRIAAEGGIKDTGGDLQTIMGRPNLMVPVYGALRNDKTGADPDRMRELLVEEKFLPEGATLNDLYEAIDATTRGRPVYSQAAAAEIEARVDEAERKAEKYGDGPRYQRPRTEKIDVAQGSLSNEQMVIPGAERVAAEGKKAAKAPQRSVAETPLFGGEQAASGDVKKADAERETKRQGSLFQAGDRARFRVAGEIDATVNLSPQDKRRRDAVLRAITVTLTRMAGKARPQAAAFDLMQVQGQDIWGVYSPADNLIAVSMRSPDPIGTVRHETIHVLRATGIISDEAWSALEQAAATGGWLEKHQIAERWGEDMSREQAFEEAIAEEFGVGLREGVWKTGNAKVDAIFQRIAEFLRRVRAEVKRALAAAGMRDTSDADVAEYVFSLIEQGAFRSDAPMTAAQREAMAQASLSDASLSEAGPNGVPRRAERFRYLAERQAAGSKSLGILDVPSRRNVLSDVFRAAKNAKIRDAIVALIPVDVMDILARQKLSPEMLLDDEAMLLNLGATTSNARVPRGIDVATALADAAALATAEVSGRSLGVPSEEGFGAGLANQGDDHDGTPRGIEGEDSNTDPSLRAMYQRAQAGAQQAAARPESQRRSFLSRAIAALKGGDLVDPRAKVREPHDIGLARKIIVTPRTIGAYFPEFARVFRAGVRQFRTRDMMISDFTAMARGYTDLPQESKEKIGKVLEHGRMAGETYAPAADGTIKVKNKVGQQIRGKLGGVTLMKDGEEVTLTPDEARGYRAYRATMDAALDRFRSQVLREWGYDPADAETPRDAQAVEEIAKDTENAGERARLKTLASILLNIQRAKKTGYVPFTRHGSHFVTVTSLQDGRSHVVHREHIEPGLTTNPKAPWHLKKLTIPRLEQEAARLRARLAEIYPPDQGFEISALQEVTPDTVTDLPSFSDLDAILAAANLPPEQSAKVMEAVGEAIKKRGFRAHFIKSRNIPGYSTDLERSLADYIVGISGYLARREHMPEIEEAIAGIPAREPKLREYAKAWNEYIQNPSEELQTLRQVGFFMYLGGRISSALVNLSQIPVVTMPWLTTFSNPVAANAQIARAYKDVVLAVRPLPKSKGGAGLDVFDADKLPADVRDVVRAAVKDGRLLPIGTFDVMATARGRTPGARTFAAKTQVVKEGLAYAFQAAERTNRLVTFIAAYRLAQSPEVMRKVNETMRKDGQWTEFRKERERTAEDFATFSVEETQFVQGKVNRSTVMRGPGTAIFQFKSFALNYFELLARLGFFNVIGRRGTYSGGTRFATMAGMMGMLLLTSGLMGFPGAEDGLDLFELSVKYFTGIDPQFERKIREAGGSVAAAIVAALGGGEEAQETARGAGGRMLARGPLREIGIDVSQRVGQGRIAPQPTGGQFDPFWERAFGLLGVPASLAMRAPATIAHLWKGEWTAAGISGSPEFIADQFRAYELANEGVKTRARGQLVMRPDDTLPDGTVVGGGRNVTKRIFGFQPAGIARAREQMRAVQRAGTSATALHAEWNIARAKLAARAEKAKDKGDVPQQRMAERDLAALMKKIERHNETAAPEARYDFKSSGYQTQLRTEMQGQMQQSTRKAPKRVRGELGTIRSLY